MLDDDLKKFMQEPTTVEEAGSMLAELKALMAPVKAAEDTYSTIYKALTAKLKELAVKEMGDDTAYSQGNSKFSISIITKELRRVLNTDLFIKHALSQLAEEMDGELKKSFIDFTQNHVYDCNAILLNYFDPSPKDENLTEEHGVFKIPVPSMTFKGKLK